MKIGLLECDHVRDELQYIAGDYRQMFPALFEKVNAGWEFQFYDVCNGQFPGSVDECDAYICTGSKNSVYDDETWILKLKDFVRSVYQSDRVFVGVCFGHQMLGEALGGKVNKASVGWCVGVHTYEIVRSETWMTPSAEHFNLLMMCQDQVLVMPSESVLLAKTADCPHAMFRIGNRILGMQAHPEFSKAYDQALMELRIERMGEEKVKSGIESLKKSVDDLLVAEWIVKFVEEAMS